MGRPVSRAHNEAVAKRQNQKSQKRKQVLTLKMGGFAMDAFFAMAAVLNKASTRRFLGSG